MYIRWGCLLNTMEGDMRKTSVFRRLGADKCWQIQHHITRYCSSVWPSSKNVSKCGLENKNQPHFLASKTSWWKRLPPPPPMVLNGYPYEGMPSQQCWSRICNRSIYCHSGIPNMLYLASPTLLLVTLATNMGSRCNNLVPLSNVLPYSCNPPNTRYIWVYTCNTITYKREPSLVLEDYSFLISYTHKYCSNHFHTKNKDFFFKHPCLVYCHLSV